jgi:hypothetical protein
MKFGEWQASRGIQPWITKPQHIAPAIDALTAAIFKAADGMKSFGETVARLSACFNSNKEDI